MVDINFKTKFLKNQGRRATIIINHNVFGEKKYEVDRLHILYDENMVGVRVKNQNIYVQADEVRGLTHYKNTFEICSLTKKIKIILKKHLKTLDNQIFDV